VATKRREWTLLTLTMGERCRHGRGNERPGERCSKVRCCYSYGCIYRLIVDCLRVGCEMRFSWFRGFVCVVLGMCLSGVLGWRADDQGAVGRSAWAGDCSLRGPLASILYHSIAPFSPLRSTVPFTADTQPPHPFCPIRAHVAPASK
jgi:hypothetical protein